MSELYKEPTPREAADMSAKLLKEQLELTLPDGVPGNIRPLEASEVPLYQEQLAVADAIKSLTTIDEVRDYLQTEPNTDLASYYLGELDGKGLGKLHETVTRDATFTKEMLDRYSQGSEAKDKLRNYAERFNDKLVIAALAEAALDGVQIDRPDAINVQK